ncbi:MAG: ASKHA domain-containing protein [Armatimonadota bacterium]
MPKFSVTFLPDKKKVVLEGKKTILEAAELAGVYVNSVCGGDALCGRCKVIVRSGEVSAPPTAYLTRAEIQSGYVLACESCIDGDAIIEVPAESRIVGGPRLTDEDALRFGATRVLVGEGGAYPKEPLSRKQFLALPQPTLEDRLADLERLYRELRRDLDIPILQIGHAELCHLGKLLRQSDWKVTATLGQRGGTVEVVHLENGDTSGRNFGVAVDIGTTTVVAHLVDLNTSETVARQATYNSQIQYGEDIISRIMYADANDKLASLTSCVIGDINNLVAGLVVSAGVSLHDVTFVLCAGNTTMIHMLLGLDPSAIRREPYIPMVVSPPVLRAAEVGVKINPRGLLACVPSVSSYVGGDVVAGVLVSGMGRADEPSMLIDVGTNGEIAIGNKDWLVCCSASAGPSFEGGGISCGMRATHGAIERLTMGKGCRVTSYSVVGGGRPSGMCGSGLIDTIAEMLRTGCLERSGVFSSNGQQMGKVRDGDDGVEFVLVEGSETATGKDIVITQADVTNFIRSKGAIYHAAYCLLHSVGLEFTDLQHIYISGGFGNYVDVRKAIMIGLVPDVPVDRFQFIGNGSVQGAKTVLLSKQALAEAEALASKMTYIELSTDPTFMNEYTAALFLPHTNIELFPSVRQEITAL